MNYAKFQSKIMKWPLVQKIKNVILVPKKKKIVNVWKKNVISPVQLKKGNVPITKNDPLKLL